MRYPVFIETGSDDTAYGVAVPDRRVLMRLDAQAKAAGQTR